MNFLNIAVNFNVQEEDQRIFNLLMERLEKSLRGKRLSEEVEEEVRNKIQVLIDLCFQDQNISIREFEVVETNQDNYPKSEIIQYQLEITLVKTCRIVPYHGRR